MLDVIIFNGPPSCGKDTAKNFIMEQHGDVCAELRFASPIKRAVHELLCLSHIDEEAYAHLKDVSSPEAFEFQMRDLYKTLSEEYAKVEFGRDIFGKLWLRNYEKILQEHKKNYTDYTIEFYPLMVIADCGFIEELEPLIKHFGEDRMCLIQIQRPTCDFVNDSRGYIDTSDIPTYKLVNYINDLDRYKTNLFKLLEDIGALKSL